MSLPYDVTPPPRGEDLPYDDGEPMETERHRKQMQLCVESLELAWADRDDVYVAGNMALYFSMTQAKNQDFRAPDVFVVLGTAKRERKSWVVWEEDGKLPDIVIEITSPSTEAFDRGAKKRIYGSVLHVPFYAIFDPFTGKLDAYELAGGALREIEPDAEGRVACAPARLLLAVREGTYLGVTCPWLRWLDLEGNVLPHGGERLHAEQARVDAANDEAARLRAKLVAAGLDPDG
jgi:Uma2 family endonuclease